MATVQATLTILHLVGGGFWLAGTVVLTLILHPVWRKYREYSYINNLRFEVIRELLRAFHVFLAICVVSGAGLMALSGKTPWEGVFGLLFSAKMLTIVALFFILQPYLQFDEIKSKTVFFHRFSPRGTLIFILAILLVVLSVSLKYV